MLEWRCIVRINIILCPLCTDAQVTFSAMFCYLQPLCPQSWWSALWQTFSLYCLWGCLLFMCNASHFTLTDQPIRSLHNLPISLMMGAQHTDPRLNPCDVCTLWKMTISHWHWWWNNKLHCIQCISFLILLLGPKRKKLKIFGVGIYCCQ